MTTTRTSTFGEADLVALLQGAIGSAGRRLWLVIPWWHAKEQPHPAALLSAVAQAAERGVDVRVMIRNEASNTATIQTLHRAGAQVRPVRHVHYKELHVDGQAWSFSANFTTLELERNQNVGYEIRGADRDAAEAAFVSLWGANTDEVAAGSEVSARADTIVPAELLPLIEHEQLNPLQSKVLPVVFGTREHLVVVAPTGAGKTIIGEAAVLRAIKLEGRRAVYITPARALTRELSDKFARWARQGVQVAHLTGEDDLDLAAVRSADLWVATTEKFESLCRRASLAQAVADVGCIVVDEIHYVGSPGRGPTLEALLARLRHLADQTRIVGLSATVANAPDLAAWLGATYLESTWRPVQLSVQVLGYKAGKTTAETNRAKNLALLPIVTDVTGDGGQVVIFCGSKFNARLTAAFLADLDRPDLNDAEGLARQCAEAGVGLHYRGLAASTYAEQRFRARDLKILVATSGLAQGVNLPARAVIVRDTTLGQTPLSVGDALQMLGRAGRHGQETEGYGFLLAPDPDLGTWRGGLADGHAVHSQILESLPDHILADVLLGRVATAAEARDWFTGTFAAYEGQAGDAPLDAALNLLLCGGFLTATGDNQALACTELGALTSRFLVSVSAGATLLEALRKIPPTEDPAAAEQAVLLSVAATVPTFRDAACPPQATDHLDALLATTPYRHLPDKTSPGARKTLLAAHLALTDAARLDSRAPLGPFSTVDLRDLCAELPRYLSWVGALGRATMLGWPVSIAADLSARIQWRHIGPERGAGRLLRFLADMLPVDARRTQMRELFGRAVARGKASPDDITEKPKSQPLSDAQWTQLAARTVHATINDVTIDGDSLVINASGPPGADLVALVTAHAGVAPTTVRADHWSGGSLRLPIPRGSAGGKVAVDLLLFGRHDWGYAAGTWPVDVSEEGETSIARRLISQLPEAATVEQAAGFISRTFGSADKRRARQIAGLVEADQPYLAPVARHLAGVGDPTDGLWRLRTSLAALLTPANDPGLRSPADVLRSGTANADEFAITLACLLGSLGIDKGVAFSRQRDIVALVAIDGAWKTVSTPGAPFPAQLTAITPPALPALVADVGEQPPSPDVPVTPRLGVLGEYRRVARPATHPAIGR